MFTTSLKTLHRTRWYWTYCESVSLISFELFSGCFCWWVNSAHNFLHSLFVKLEQQVQNFGEPFFLVIHEGETLAEVKVRVQKKLQVPDDEFSKVTFPTPKEPSAVFQFCQVPNLSKILFPFYFCSGSLHSCHWVVRSTCRILTLFLVVFRFVYC